MTTTAMHPDTAKALALLLAGYTLTEAADTVHWPAGALRKLVDAQKGWLVDGNGRVYDPGQSGYRPRVPDGLPLAEVKWAADLKKMTPPTTRTGAKPVTGIPIEQARALALLCQGRTAKDAANTAGIPLGRLVQLARRQGWTIHPSTGLALEENQQPTLPNDLAALLAAAGEPPSPEEPTDQPGASALTKDPAPTAERAPQPSPVSKVDQLLADARACDDRLVHAALRRAETALGKLADAYGEAAERIAAEQRAERERQAALAEIAELERKLASARERAKQVGAKPKRPAAPAAERPTGPTNAEIRAWAQANGVECNQQGRIPQAVRDQYDTAHPAVTT